MMERRLAFICVEKGLCTFVVRLQQASKAKQGLPRLAFVSLTEWLLLLRNTVTLDNVFEEIMRLSQLA